MKKVVRSILSIVIIITLSLPQIVSSYEFENDKNKQKAKSKKGEIYDLYNMRKELVGEEKSSNNQFGFIGYNGVCSTVQVDGGSVTLDEYIAGVIKAEMGGSSLEALKAQAIAARSFLLSTHKNSSSCRVTNGQSYQAYKKDSDSNSIYRRAVAETSGMVVERKGEIALTQYQSYPAGRWQKSDSSGWHVEFQRFADDNSTKWKWDGPPKDVVKAGYGGTEMDYNNAHNWGMSQTIAVYLASKEGYTYEQIIDLFYKEKIVTINDGVYDQNIQYLDSPFGKIGYWNQRDFKDYYYSANPTSSNTYGGTISSHGCGPTSVAIVVSSFLNQEISPIKTTEQVCLRGGCTSNGSTIGSLSDVISKDYNLKTRWTSKDQDVIDALGRKELVIVLMGPGVFTTGGHYIVLTGVNSNRQVSVADPASRERTNKQWFSFNTIIEQRKKYAQYLIISR